MADDYFYDDSSAYDNSSYYDTQADSYSDGSYNTSDGYYGGWDNSGNWFEGLNSDSGGFYNGASGYNDWSSTGDYTNADGSYSSGGYYGGFDINGNWFDGFNDSVTGGGYYNSGDELPSSFWDGAASQGGLVKTNTTPPPSQFPYQKPLGTTQPGGSNRSSGGGGSRSGGGGGRGGMGSPQLQAPKVPQWQDVYNNWSSGWDQYLGAGTRAATNLNAARYNEMAATTPGMTSNLNRMGQITTDQLQGRVPLTDVNVADIKSQAGNFNAGFGGVGGVNDARRARDYGLLARDEIARGQQSMTQQLGISQMLNPYSAGQFTITPYDQMSRDLAQATGNAQIANQNAIARNNAANQSAAMNAAGGAQMARGSSSPYSAPSYQPSPFGSQYTSPITGSSVENPQPYFMANEAADNPYYWAGSGDTNNNWSWEGSTMSNGDFYEQGYDPKGGYWDSISGFRSMQ